MWDTSRLRMHGILQLLEVLQAQWEDKRSYLWYFKNLACGDLLERDGIKKYWIHVFPGLVLRKWGRSCGVVGFSMCGVLFCELMVVCYDVCSNFTYSVFGI